MIMRVTVDAIGLSWKRWIHSITCKRVQKYYYGSKKYLQLSLPIFLLIYLFLTVRFVACTLAKDYLLLPSFLNCSSMNIESGYQLSLWFSFHQFIFCRAVSFLLKYLVLFHSLLWSIKILCFHIPVALHSFFQLKCVIYW